MCKKISKVGILSLLLIFFTASVSAQPENFSSTGIIISDGVRVRSAPSLDAEKVSALNHGTLVTILDRSEFSMSIGDSSLKYWWYLVQKDSLIGWVYGAFCYCLYENKDSQQTILIDYNGYQSEFNSATAYSRPDVSEDDYSASQNLVCFIPFSNSRLYQGFFVSIDKKLAENNNLTITNDGWLMTTASPSGGTTLIDAQTDSSGDVIITLLKHSDPDTWKITLRCRVSLDRSMLTAESAENHKLIEVE